MLEKTFTTFHSSNVPLQQQYREQRFTKYCELISCLLVAEQNNELLMRNHQSRPTGIEPFPEVNAISSQNCGRGRGHGGGGGGGGHGGGRSRGRGHGRNSQHYNDYPSNSQKRKAPFHHHKWSHGEAKQITGENT